MIKKVTEEMIEDLKCISCGDDVCCPTCSFIDDHNELVPWCHDCGEWVEELNQGEESEIK